MKNFVLTKKQRHFGPFFGPKFGHFRSKIRFSVIFFESAHQISLKLGQKLGTIALNRRMAVLCLGKFLLLLLLLFLKRDWPLLFLCVFFNLATAERPQHCALVIIIIIGLSALADGPMDSRLCVRPFVHPFVRDAISGDPRIRF